MELFDTHFHFDGRETYADFLCRCHADMHTAAADFRELPERLLMLCAGSDYKESAEAMELAQNVPEIYFACGVHPHAAQKYLDEEPEDFSIFHKQGKLVAIGEIGLDYFYGYSDRSSQQAVLGEFLDLALKWQLPAMLHLRDRENCFEAYDDALCELKDFSRRGGRFVIHCYAGNRDYAEKFLELGGYFGVTGMYTFKAASNIRDAVSIIPDERLLIETDSPYLSPVPYRGRVNSPGMVALVAQALGTDRNMTPENAAETFSRNGKNFYRIGMES